jgi:1-phosphatidylinositol-3-phosphate 5-kinase
VKNDEYRELQKIVIAYWDSVIARIKAFNHELLPADRAEAGRMAMQALAEAAATDRQTFMRMLDKAYEDAEVNKPSSMNVVRHALMKKINTWDNDFIA